MRWRFVTIVSYVCHRCNRWMLWATKADIIFWLLNGRHWSRCDKLPRLLSGALGRRQTWIIGPSWAKCQKSPPNVTFDGKASGGWGGGGVGGGGIKASIGMTTVIHHIIGRINVGDVDRTKQLSLIEVWESWHWMTQSSFRHRIDLKSLAFGNDKDSSDTVLHSLSAINSVICEPL